MIKLEDESFPVALAEGWLVVANEVFPGETGLFFAERVAGAPRGAVRSPEDDGEGGDRNGPADEWGQAVLEAFGVEADVGEAGEEDGEHEKEFGVADGAGVAQGKAADDAAPGDAGLPPSEEAPETDDDAQERGGVGVCVVGEGEVDGVAGQPDRADEGHVIAEDGLEEEEAHEAGQHGADGIDKVHAVDAGDGAANGGEEGQAKGILGIDAAFGGDDHHVASELVEGFAREAKTALIGDEAGGGHVAVLIGAAVGGDVKAEDEAGVEGGGDEKNGIGEPRAGLGFQGKWPGGGNGDGGGGSVGCGRGGRGGQGVGINGGGGGLVVGRVGRLGESGMVGGDGHAVPSKANAIGRAAG